MRRLTGSTHSLVSVIIPTFNCAKYVGAAVTSVLQQTYPSVEIIVINDGSTDDTCEVLRQFHDRVRVVHQCNRGVPAARNVGIALAQGKYIALLDADDKWLPHRLATMIPILEAGGCDLLTSNAYCVDEQGRRIGTIYAPTFECPKRDQYGRLLWRNQIFVMTVARAELFRQHGGFDETMRYGPEDWDLWLRMVRDGAKWGFVPEPLAEYTVRRGSKSRTYSHAQVADLRRMYKKHRGAGRVKVLLCYRHAVGVYRCDAFTRALRERNCGQAMRCAFALMRSADFLMWKAASKITSYLNHMLCQMRRA